MRYLVIILVLISTQLLAQVQLPANELGQVQYQEIVRLPDSKQTGRQLIEKVRAWANQQYPLANEAEQQFDQEHNILFIRTFYPFDKQSVRYTLTIEPKFGRYRATLTDLMIEDNGIIQPIRAASSTADEMKQTADSAVKNEILIRQIAADQGELYRQLDKSCRATLASLKKAMTGSSTSGK